MNKQSYYTEDHIKSILQWANCLERQDNFPLDRTDLHPSYAEAALYARGNGEDSRGLGPLAYIGQQVTVWGPNELGVSGVWVYTLVPTEKTDKDGNPYLAELKPLGNGFEILTYSTYKDAVDASGTLRSGTLIKVSKSWTNDSGETFPSGFYIVETPGTISALGTFNGTAGEEDKANVQIQIDIDKLKELFGNSSTETFTFNDLGIEIDTDFTKTDICVGGYYPVQKKMLNGSVEFYYYTIESELLDRISLSINTNSGIIFGSWTNVKITESELENLFKDSPSS